MRPHQNGARLSYVVVPLDGVVKRETITYNREGGLRKKTVEQPAGYMVYFPQGHALRFKTKADLEQYGLNVEPHIINMNGMHTRNSPMGKLMAAQDEEARKKAYVSLEDQVIKLATAHTGSILMPEQLSTA
jgi:hypothetical protein